MPAITQEWIIWNLGEEAKEMKKSMGQPGPGTMEFSSSEDVGQIDNIIDKEEA